MVLGEERESWRKQQCNQYGCG
jgi:hypothetical protein